MRSAKLTMAKYLLLLFVACGLQIVAFSQENSPYSRYGLGDLVPSQNITNRAMGGIAAGYSDFQSINFVNPASLGNITNTIFDLGAEADIRTLKSLNPAKKYTQSNSLFSYLQVGFPIASKKMIKKHIGWGVSVGLRPISRIDYKIEKQERISTIDSLTTLYEGTGGVTQAFIGTGFHTKHLNIGLDFGYMFGNKDFNTRLAFINDTVTYYKSNSGTKTHFGGLFVTGGIQYQTELSAGTILRIGAYGTLQHNLKATQDITRETFQYDANGGTYRLDSIYDQSGISGTIQYPSSFGAGFSYSGKQWLYGADFETANWSNYRYMGQADALRNNWTIRGGVQYYPAKENTPSKKYFNFVKYRAGFYYGPDYIQPGASRPQYAFTMGTGMPLTSLQRIRFGEYVLLNTALEIGGRGDKNSNVKENIVRFSIGLSMNARWFVKPKYD